MTTTLQIFGIHGIGEVRAGEDLLSVIERGLRASAVQLQPGDILVVTHKIVSKAEARSIDLRTVEPSPLAQQWGARWGKDPRQVEVVLREAARIVRMDRGLIIAQTHHGFVCANAGVDASNVGADETVLLLPIDPDASARRLYEALRAALGFAVPVIISDSWGRPWRDGVTNVAIGVAGMQPLADYRGRRDPYGYLLNASVMAVADELAAAAELVMGKLDQRPVAVVRGYAYQPGAGTAQQLVMPPERDLFR
ncbi:coenzyme F420-0:L-glutamate ligase [Kallotenue papyrolyticum]|uniref:coenzyme F420-0:L-glutamate ligase n=1 Tax=Kallotenue papyrolyticum TaxID=1325125 RepID=UPI000471411D|nr:coenzyme F420-0:L-glutamate ligase [Kallotenue papyrolyticum]